METETQIDSISSFELFGSGMVGGDHRACQPVRTIRLTVSQPRPDTSITACRPKVLETLTRRPSSNSSIDIPVYVPLTKDIVVEECDLQPVKVGYILENDIMRQRLPDPFAKIQVDIVDGTVEFRLDDPKLSMEDFEEKGNALVDALVTLATEIKCTTHEFEGEKYPVALGHFAYYCRRWKSIKYYKEDNLKLMFAYTSDDDGNLVQQHVEIISDQQIVEGEVAVSADQVCAIEGTNVDLGDICAASTAVQDDKILLFGIQEDVATARLKLHKILSTLAIKSDNIEAYAVKLLERDSVKRLVHDVLRKSNLKWFVKEQTLYVVGKKVPQVESGVSAVKEFFKRISLNVSRKERGARGWLTFVTLLKLQCGDEIDIDDDDESKVFINVTENQRTAVIQHLREKRSSWALTNKRVPLEPDTCEFVISHLTELIINDIDVEFLEIKKASDGRTIELDGTEDEVKFAAIAVAKIARADLYGVPNARAAIFLKDTGRNMVVAGMNITQFKKQIVLKEGRIEDENVDVIVNSAPYSLVLKQADKAVTTSIINKAGTVAQDDLKGKADRLASDHMVEGAPGNLQCKQLYHVALDEYDPKKEAECQKVLSDVVMKCLRTASRSGHKTIAFPAICTGILKYPCDTVAKTMLGTIVPFLNSERQATIETIYFVILKNDKTDKGKSKKRIFEKEINSRQQRADEERDCLVSISPWVFHSECHLIVPTKEDVEPTVDTLNKQFHEQTFEKQVV